MKVKSKFFSGFLFEGFIKTSNEVQRKQFYLKLTLDLNDDLTSICHNDIISEGPKNFNFPIL